jgi:hypothetical protein
MDEEMTSGPTGPGEYATLRGKRRWSDFTPAQQRAIMAGAFAELVVTTIAFRDLARRPRDQVRGFKVVWTLLFVVQPFGPILYLLTGRRRDTA